MSCGGRRRREREGGRNEKIRRDGKAAKEKPLVVYRNITMREMRVTKEENGCERCVFLKGRQRNCFCSFSFSLAVLCWKEVRLGLLTLSADLSSAAETSPGFGF